MGYQWSPPLSSNPPLQVGWDYFSSCDVYLWFCLLITVCLSHSTRINVAVKFTLGIFFPYAVSFHWTQMLWGCFSRKWLQPPQPCPSTIITFQLWPGSTVSTLLSVDMIQSVTSWCTSACDTLIFRVWIKSMLILSHSFLLSVRSRDVLEGIANQIPSFQGLKFSGSDLMDFGQCVSYSSSHWSLLYGIDEVSTSSFSSLSVLVSLCQYEDNLSLEQCFPTPVLKYPKEYTFLLLPQTSTPDSTCQIIIKPSII